MRPRQKQRGSIQAFSLIEALVAMGLFGVAFISLYGGISAGMQLVQVARENLRATQILVEKTETLRLYSWEQVAVCTNIPTTFTANYYPPGIGSQGITYHGRVTITEPPFSTAYAPDIRMATVTLYWTNFNVPHSRSVTTMIARHGMQNYIF